MGICEAGNWLFNRGLHGFTRMKGRRIPVPANGNIFDAVTQPGDYCGPVEGDTIRDGKRVMVRKVAFLLPIATPGLPFEQQHGANGVHHVAEPPHVFTEEPDGTLTIRESILSREPRTSKEIWHGYLTKGEWTP